MLLGSEIPEVVEVRVGAGTGVWRGNAQYGGILNPVSINMLAASNRTPETCGQVKVISVNA